MKLIICGVIFLLLALALIIITIINWRKESFIKSFLAGVFFVIGILLICFEVGSQIDISNIQSEDKMQVEYCEVENVV